jgi:predicted dehydrogenase
MMKKTLCAIVLFFAAYNIAMSQSTLRVVVAGLNHDHVHGILSQYKKGAVNVISIVEPDKGLQQQFAKRYSLPESLFDTDLKKVLTTKKPDAVLGYNAVAHHVDLVEVAAPLGISVMVEKPLAATLEQARRMESLAKQYGIKVLTNFETTWYPSYQQVYDWVNADSIGTIKKIVAHDGHQGPQEIGCSRAFLSWLTDPVGNGAGALNDFGCYGADLMTWFMKGARPVAVTAIVRQYKPNVYAKVDDDATVLVEYKNAVGQIEASWNWPFSIKDLEVFGETGYYHALDGKNIVTRMREHHVSESSAQTLPAPINDPITYLTAVLQNKISGTADQSSLEYNMIVMEILDAAKRSAAAGKRIVL